MSSWSDYIAFSSVVDSGLIWGGGCRAGVVFVLVVGGGDGGEGKIGCTGI